MANTQISNKKLKAIVFTDIVDFTKLSAEDEQHALNLIDKQREIVKPIVEKHNGEWLKEIGDGLLFSFDSSLDAVNCSIEIQQNLKDIEDFKIRIGIHQGDIFIKDGDVFGDDVNIASRVESFSPAGGVTISDKVYKDIQGVKEIKTSFIGHKPLKGVKQETKVRCITSNDLPKHKTNIFHKINIFLNFTFGIQMLLLFIVVLLQYLTGGKVQFNFSDFENVVLVFNTAIIFILLGYSSLSYTRGVSIKSQKIILYFSYFYISYYFFTEVVSSLLPMLLISLTNRYSTYSLIPFIILILPIIIIYAFFFRKQNRNK